MNRTLNALFAVALTLATLALALAPAIQAPQTLDAGRSPDQVRTIGHELANQGRDPTAFGIGKRVYLAVDDDAERARRGVLDGLRRIYGRMPGIENVPVSGAPEEVVRGLRAVRDAGAQLIVLTPLGATVADDREQMERLAAEVVPQLV